MSSQTSQTMGPFEWALLIALSVLWGGSFFFNGVAVQELPTLTIVMARVALAAVILLVILKATGKMLPFDPVLWKAFFTMGLLNNVIPFSLIVWGQGHIASGVAAILNAMTPVMTVLVAHFLTTDEKLSPLRFLGVGLGVLGVVILMGGGSGWDEGGITLVAKLACVGATLSYGFAGVFGRRFKALGVTPMQTAAGQISASTVLLFPVALLVDQPWTLAMPGFDTIAALIGLAGLSTALAYIMFFQILARAGATNIALVTFLVPVSAILLGIGILGEVLLAQHLYGMALIGAGLAAIDGRLFRKRP